VIRGLGWRPDTPDHRDLRFRATVPVANLPPNVDLSTYFPPAWDQGQLGSCTAFGTKGAVWYCRARERLPQIDLSALFTYYNSRVIENSVASDAGAEIRDVVKALAATGAAPESDWPYDVSKFSQKPPDAAYTDALQDVVKSYARVDQTADAIRACIASAWPVVFGVTLYESFQSDAVAKTGLVPMPSTSEQVLGGHCMLIVGYDDPSRQFQVRNSWGTWGDKGNCWIGYDYLVNADLASDFWQIDATGA
jgi:C1A family cysteine protease